MNILDIPPKDGLRDFLTTCETFFTYDKKTILTYVLRDLRYAGASKEKQERMRYGQTLENKWYEALANGRVDYSVYDSLEYLGNLWACWIIYSRKYLRSLKPSGILDYMGNIDSVLDLGCGFGYTTIALKQLFPDAAVYGTNIETSAQTNVAKHYGEKYSFRVIPDAESIGHIDLVFASEYYEHFLEPIVELKRVLTNNTPKYFLIANSFGTTSIGHFPAYTIDGSRYNGKETSAIFHSVLREYGYRKIKTKLWNNRPSFWEKL